MRGRQRLGGDDVVAEGEDPVAQHADLGRVAVQGEHDPGSLDLRELRRQAHDAARLDAQHLRALRDDDAQRLDHAPHAEGELRGVQDRVAGQAQGADEALRADGTAQLAGLDERRGEPELVVAALVLRQLLQVALLRGEREAAVLLEIAVDAVLFHEGADLGESEQGGVVVGPRGVGAPARVDPAEARLPGVREAAVAAARPVAAARAFEQDDALPRQTPREVIGGGHAREAPAHDRHVGALAPAEGRTHGLLPQAGGLHPEAVDVELVERRGPVGVVGEAPTREHRGPEHAGAAEDSPAEERAAREPAVAGAHPALRLLARRSTRATSAEASRDAATSAKAAVGPRQRQSSTFPTSGPSATSVASVR